VNSRAAAPIGLAALLAGLSMLSPFSIDTFFPSFRAISAEFSLSTLEIQQTLTAYLLPYAFMSLVHGPLSDALGRRPVVLAGLVLYAAASLACALAPGFGTLLAFRAMQGMTAGAGFTVSRAIVRDLYEGPQAQRLMALITMIFGLAPAIAPVVGGWLHVAFGWRSVFVFLTLLGLALTLAAAMRLPETHPPARRVPLRVGELVENAWRIGSRRQFFVLSAALGLQFSSVLVFVGAAPAVVLDHWGRRETEFAWLFLPIIGGFVLGAFFSGRLAGRRTPARQARAGFVTSVAAAALLAAATGGLANTPVWLQQALLFAAAIGAQLVAPVVTLRLLDMFPATRGAVSSVQSFIQLLISTAAIGLVVPAVQGSLVTLALTSLAGAAAAFLLWRFALTREERRGPLPA
jgi:DHA1 family bicyclomycin/chloramphenicol resistance-like MFS transporter